MDNDLKKIIDRIGDDYKEMIEPGSNVYLEVDIGAKARHLGQGQIEKAYRAVNAVVPIKAAVSGMKVMIDGRTFVDYAQFDSGIAVPGYVARAAGLAHRHFSAPESMVLNF